jgi:hypothetical protein
MRRRRASGPYREFAARLDRYMAAAGFLRRDGTTDREAFARAVGRARATIDRWLSGTMFPEDSLEAISGVVGKSLSELRYGLSQRLMASPALRPPVPTARIDGPPAAAEYANRIDPEWRGFIVPILQVLVEMLRKAHTTRDFYRFDHLLRQIGILIDHDVQPNQTLDLALRAFAELKERKN